MTREVVPIGRLAEQGHQRILHVATGATLLQLAVNHHRQTQGFVQLTRCRGRGSDQFGAAPTVCVTRLGRLEEVGSPVDVDGLPGDEAALVAD